MSNTNRFDISAAAKTITVQVNRAALIGAAYVNSTAPENPNTGELWYDSTETRLKMYNGTAWVETTVLPDARTNAEIKTDYESNPDTNAYTDAEKAKLAGIEAGATQDQTGAEIKTALFAEADTNNYDDAAVAKLAGIEAGATGDQTAAEIKTAYESNADTNNFDDAAVAKLAGIEAGADVTDAINVEAAGAVMDSDVGVTVQAHSAILDNTTASYTTAEETKLAGIEANATADMSDAEIKVAYESNADTNAFTDADNTKLVGIEAGATQDQTGAEIKALYEAEADTNAFTDADVTKLAGIETGATADMTAAEIKTAYESNADTNNYDDAAVAKLAGIEANATADMTAAEIKTAYESNLDTNNFDDAAVTKLAGIEANATADQTGSEIKALYEAQADTNVFDDAAETKLAGIETGATADQTGAEIKALYEAEADTNAFTDAEQTKLAGIDANATDDQTGAEIKALYEAELNTNAFTDAEKTKLAGIDANATDDMTAAEIKTAYESNADTNAFTDAEQTKLAGIDANATDDQTGAEIKALYEAEADTNAYTDAEKTKLAGIEAAADVTDTANVTAAGAVMDSELADEAAVKAINQQLTTTSDVNFNDLTLAGDLIINGTTTTVNSNDVHIGDNIITLNSDETGTPSQDAGIEIERGTDTNKTLVWDEANDKWTVGSETFVAATFEGNLTGNITGQVTDISNHTTTDLAEGTNKYYTDARVNTAIDTRVDKTFIDNLNVDADTLDGIDSTGFATAAQGTLADSALQSADIGLTVQAHSSVLDNTTASYTTAEATKLAGIEANAKDDQTGAEIKALYEAEADTNVFDDAAVTKLAGIEANATADQTGSEIKSLYEAEADTNAFTDAEKTKLAGIDANATDDMTGAEIKALYEAEANAFTDAQFTKLAGIETGATADMTAAEIKTAYESNLDTNAYDDAAVSKLAGIEANATADMTAAEIKTAYESNADTNAYDDAAVTKLAGIEAGADVTDAANVEAAGAVMDADIGVTVQAHSTVLDNTTASYTTAEETKLAGIEAGADVTDAVNVEAAGAVMDADIGVTVQAHSAVLDATTASYTTAEATKLAGIETGATADQTGAEIKAAYEAELDTNAFTDSEKSKLAGIETGATADMTGAEIKAAYEAEADTNAYTDADVAKLAGIEANATADQTGAEIKTALFAEADTNNYDDAAVTKLAGIEAAADVTDTANVTAAGAVMDSELTNEAAVKAIDQQLTTTSDVTFNDVTVDGDLTVNGTVTTVNTETIELADNIIVVNSNETGAPSQDAGIEVERGTDANKTLIWDETNDKWTVGSETFVAGTVEANVTGQVSDISNHSTTNLAEGTNLYYTDARAQAAISLTSSNTAELSYNDTTGEFTYTSPTTIGQSTSVTLDVRNTSGATIAKGVPVYIAGHSGSKVLVAPADANDASKMPAIGVMAGAVSNNDDGSVTSFGLIVGIDTSTFSEGDTLYVDTTPGGSSFGGLTNTAPTGETSAIQNIGKVARSDSNGEVIISGPGRSNATPNLNDGKFFIGNASNQSVAATFSTEVGNVVDKAYVDALNIDADTLDGNDSTAFATAAQGTLADSALQSADIGVSVQAHSTVLDNTTASYTTAEETKLAGIEAGATGDQTAAEIKTAYESNLDTNAYTDAEKTKLSGIEANATQDQTGAEIKALYEAEADTNAYTDADVTKLAGIETGADVTDAANVEPLVDAHVNVSTATSNQVLSWTGTDYDWVDMTATMSDADIKTAYENNADTNAYTDAEKTKLAGIEAGATGDQTAAEIKTAYESNLDTNAYDDAAVTKLAGIEAGADVTDAANVEPLVDSHLNQSTATTSQVLSWSGTDYDWVDMTATMSDAEVKTAYENNADTNAYTDAEKTKLAGIETGATADQTGAEIKTALFAELDTNNYDDAAVSKLAGIEALADVTDATNVQAAGAVMDSELTDEAAVKAINQGLTTTSDVNFNDLTLAGDLIVNGTTTTVNTETIELADNIILINSNEAGTPSQNGGIEIERGTETNKTLVWDETADKWTVGSETFVAGTFEGNLTGNITGTVSDISNHSTTNLTEGTNLYYTDARANSAIDTRVNKAFVDALNVDADTLDGKNSTAFAELAVGGKFLNDIGTNDDVYITVGTGNDLNLYHDAIDSYIDNVNGDLYIMTEDTHGVYIGGTTSGMTSASFIDGGAVDLHYGANVKFATTNTGVNITGNIVVSGTVDGRDVAADGTKLDGIETGATADQTGAEIKTALFAEADTNNYDDAAVTKLSGIEAGADVTDATNVEAAGAVMDADIGVTVQAYSTVLANTTASYTTAEETKLAGIEANATADQTGAEIKTAYEAEADTNAYTDAEKTKLSGIEANATQDQTGAEIKALYEAEADTNAFTDADHTKLNGIEANATADQTGAEIKTALFAELDTNNYDDAAVTKLGGIEAGADVTDAANVEPLVDTHLNTSTATSSQLLSWTGTDYDWVDAGSYSDSDVNTHLNQSTAGTDEVLAWNGTDYEWIPDPRKTVISDISATPNTIAAGSSGTTFRLESGSGTVNLNNANFSAGDTITIINNTASDKTLTFDAWTAVRIAGDTASYASSSITLAARGVATMVCTTSSEAYISGNVS